MALKIVDHPPAPAKSGETGNASPKGVKGYGPSESGNRNGRPRGSRNWASRLAEQMVEDDVEAIIGGLVEKAKGGDFQAQKFLAERLLPRKRSRPLSIPLPVIETAADIVVAIDQIWSAVGLGMITPDESDQLLRLLEAKRKSIETVELAAELEQIK